MQKYPIVALVGTSGSGKTTLLIRMLERFPDYCRVIKSTTTRARRGPEDDIFYDFVSPEQFSQLESQGQFFQTVTFGGHRYGCDREKTRAITEHFVGLTVLIQEGIEQYRAAGYKLSPVRIIPRGHTPREDKIRLHDDAKREGVDVGFEAVIINSFAPGGLERASHDLKKHIEKMISTFDG